jgi:hypothetical protein
MTNITVFHFPPNAMVDAIFHSKQQFLNRYFNQYEIVAKFDIDQYYDGEAAAEEVFDLTNNPSRQTEREVKYGRIRSVSVGDVVAVNGVAYYCSSIGWELV